MGNDPVQGCEFWSLVGSAPRDGLYSRSLAQAWGDAVAMDVMEAISSRRSVRAYTDQPVDKTTVEALIKAATRAPSSMNEQPWAFAAIQNPTQLAARSRGLGACPMGFARPCLNQARI